MGQSLECGTNIKHIPGRRISRDRFSTGDMGHPFPLLCLKVQISVAHVGVHDEKQRRGHVMGKKSSSFGVGNKLQPAVNPVFIWR